jgi:diguanylate cyclase (GGDEF)-like protein
MRASTQMLLEAAGFNDVVTVGSAQEAFQRLGMDGSDHDPADIDVILMDIVMPHMDGIEACRRIKAQEGLRDLPILMVTGNTEEHDLAAAFAAGAIDYIRKPINMVELLARMRSALALKGELDSRKARQLELMEVTRQLQEANKSLERLSTLDALTGVANRRSFNNSLHREWGRAVRDGTPLALIMIDIDFFKAYNDYYGHPRGDDCLRRVAWALHDQVKRPGDVLARYGGEEFVALLTRTGLDGAVAVAEAFRSAVERLAVEHARSPLGHVTLSLGVAATLPDRFGAADELVHTADQALYEAKHQGRNRLMVFNKAEEAASANLEAVHH